MRTFVFAVASEQRKASHVIECNSEEHTEAAFVDLMVCGYGIKNIRVVTEAETSVVQFNVEAATAETYSN